MTKNIEYHILVHKYSKKYTVTIFKYFRQIAKYKGQGALKFNELKIQYNYQTWEKYKNLTF